MVSDGISGSGDKGLIGIRVKKDDPESILVGFSSLFEKLGKELGVSFIVVAEYNGHVTMDNAVIACDEEECSTCVRRNLSFEYLTIKVREAVNAVAVEYENPNSNHLN